MKLNRLAVVAFVTMTVLCAGLASPGGAFDPYEDISSCSGTTELFAMDGPGWTNGVWDIRPQGSAALHEWEAEYTYNGTRIIEMQESFGEVVIRWQDPSHFSSPDTSGHTHPCSGIDLNIARQPATMPPSSAWLEDFRALLQHEMGHILELEHTGDEDSFDGGKPIMSTCMSFTSGSGREIRQDDWQNLHYQKAYVNGGETMSANLGFNRGLSYFAATGGNYWYTDSSARTRFKRPNWGYFYQTTAVARASGEDYGVRVNWARLYSGTYGYVFAQMYARPVTYGDQTTNCVYESGWDQNSTRTPESVWYYKGGASGYNSGSPTSLATLDTPAVSMSSLFVDIQLRAWTTFEYTNGFAQYALFDNVRVRQQ